MNTLNKVDTENLFYRTFLKCLIIKQEKTQEKEYMISIYYTAPSDIIVITIINSIMTSESYTSNISRSDYEELKKSQDLTVDFNDFAERFKTLLMQYKDEKITMKLKIDSSIVLGFYTTSDVKELVVLTIPFQYTSKEEIIKFLLKRNDLLEELCRSYLERTKALQEQYLDQKKKYQEVKDIVERTYEEKHNLESQHATSQLQCGQLRNALDDLNYKNQNLLRDLAACQLANRELEFINYQLNTDLNNLKIAAQYYTEKANYLQNIVNGVNSTHVPNIKYNRLNEMFITAIADLVKLDLSLQQIMSQRNFQETENFSLKEELSKCCDIIKNLEERLSTAVIDDPNSNLDAVSALLTKLDIEHSNSDRNQ